MKATNKIILVLAAGAITGMIVYTLQQSKKRAKLAKISEAGYETAHDILFPDKKRRAKKHRYA